MNDSIISMVFLGVLGLLFVLLIVLTIVLIVTRKKDSKEEYNEYDEEYDEDYDDEYTEEDYNESSDMSAEEDYDDGDDGYTDEGDDEDENAYDESGAADALDEQTDVNDNFEEPEKAFDKPVGDEQANNEPVQQEAEPEEPKQQEAVSEEPVQQEPVLEESVQQEAVEKNPTEPLHDDMGDYLDSAFAPYQENDNLSNEAIMASVKEAEAMSEALKYGTSSADAETLFGISDALDGGKKKQHKKSNVSSNEDFYWYNKMDVAQKPSYKTKEMYYHYFNVPKDCIEDLLVEMYDCALVRTEEIRYIAYGIEPKAVSIKDILSEGNYYYDRQIKKKEPLPQDLIKIYEKWCGYVDKLFDKVEVHADEYTIQEIRRLLCEFGRNDVDVLLEGK